ncbi:MAG: hypothetical protein A3C02_04320 [Candidatus Andersenbacteria bacterium RIFCSPHIGHO2_02_FULL_45_11]|uniref:Uncharacterized protein n=1 Tax=Candidatus Andersenbacteria bacterium RIFCSPHIGHO2_12_FULL_45_11 TaxID=1797281 RepID=A0A1G1X098_9BACT|nr:MAG: hypothetical protein A3C02_04320 [Candidatus Andersenbacteria bacterium RIFCSPHIGHO2_02_FULL_45_11]OGY33442.1 MAG: hypothetical protein A3D99_04850 [Candidatus Andersenbacteria bacterium RIFCSPHIGHO2_12_FULL_45_11]
MVNVIVVLIFLVSVILLLGYGRTYVVERQPRQAEFMKGVAGMSALDGDYKGVAHGYSGTWQGKTIFQSKKSGINRFLYGEKLEQKYPFALSFQKALRDADKDVIVLDYNQPGNPWWLKYIVDEMVEVGPQQYLGKVHVRITSGLVFTLGYFSLTK